MANDGEALKEGGGGVKPRMADALKAEHGGSSSACLSVSATDKSRGSGEIISPGGAWGGAPHTKNISLRYFWLTSDQDQMTRPTMDFCQSPSKSSMRLRTRGGLSAALSE